MNFHRSNGGQKISASAIFFCLVFVAAIAGEGFGQASHSRRVSGEPSTKISGYLVSRVVDPVEVQAQDLPTLSETDIVEKMMATSAWRLAELRAFEGRRWYHLEYHGLFGGREADMEVLATYTAPDQHNFSVLSQSGSKVLLNRVLLKLLESEKEAFQNHKQVELSPANYKFTLIGAEKIPEGDTYVLAVKPLKPNKFLYAGKIWVDAHDFAVVRMQGEPAKAPSFWIRDTQIDANWEKVGGFWFIAHNHSVSHIRMGGVATLTIDYGDYQVTAVDGHGAKTQAQGPALPTPASVAPQR